MGLFLVDRQWGPSTYRVQQGTQRAGMVLSLLGDQPTPCGDHCRLPQSTAWGARAARRRERGFVQMPTLRRARQVGSEDLPVLPARSIDGFSTAQPSPERDHGENDSNVVPAVRIRLAGRAPRRQPIPLREVPERLPDRKAVRGEGCDP